MDEDECRELYQTLSTRYPSIIIVRKKENKRNRSRNEVLNYCIIWDTLSD